MEVSRRIKMVPSGLKVVANCSIIKSKWPKMAPRIPKMAARSPRMGTRWTQDGAKTL